MEATNDFPRTHVLEASAAFTISVFVFKLKQRAEESQLIIVNHHLFFADLSLQILSSVSIFPPYEVVILDEAHQLADVATHNLSVGFSQRGFMSCTRIWARK